MDLDTDRDTHPTKRVRACGLLRLAGLLGIGLCAAACSSPPAELAPDPGRVTLRRLSRTQYDRTVQHVLGTEQRPSAAFPPDDTGYGFDNLGDVLSLSPLQLELYQRAAESLAAELVRPDGAPLRLKVAPAEIPIRDGLVRRGDELLFTYATTAAVVAELPANGTYRVRLAVYGEQAGAELVQLGLTLDMRKEQVFPVPGTKAKPDLIELTVEAFAGPHLFNISFLNDFYDPMQMLDRNLVLQGVEIIGPVEQDRPNPLRARLYTCTPMQRDLEGQRRCAHEILSRIGRLLYRRPLGEDELARLLELYESGASLQDEENDKLRFDAGLRLALEALLLSPNFLFRVELDPEPTSLTPHPLGAHELSTRLAYFLWSSAPDEALLAEADSGALLSDEGLRAAVERMLADPRAQALIDDYAVQWLSLRELAHAEPDPQSFPTFSASLRAAMAEETRRFVRDFFPLPDSPGLPLPGLFNAPFSYVNEELSAHYGLQKASGWQRVSLDGTTRRGLLTQASVLTAQSYPARTSPVRRGKWILEQLLCNGPPPPPPDVIGDFGKPDKDKTLRERLEAHRKNPVCAGCHRLMDPIGLGLEGFDAIGRARTSDAGKPIDTTGELPDGRRFADASELATLLSEDGRAGRCAAEKLFLYAVGRKPHDHGIDDSARMDRLSERFEQSGRTLRELIVGVVLSDAFRTRRGESEGGAP